MRASFSGSWSDLVKDWCLGVEPAFTEQDARLALESLERHWPERLDAAEQAPVRGIAAFAPLVEAGITLSRTEALPGFGPVMSRLRGGQGSAYAELEFAASLVRLSLDPTLEPALGQKVLDTSFAFEGRTHFVEVICPDRSEAVLDAQTLIVDLARRILAANPGMDIEVLLDPSMNADRASTVVEVVAQRGTSPDLQQIAGLASFLKPGPALSAVISPRIATLVPGPVLGCAQVAHSPEAIGAATVRIPIDDQRAQRVLSGELDHFSKDVPNILVMDVTRVIGGIGSWKGLIARCFQPTRNRRIGAVLLYSKGAVGPRSVTWERWNVIPNDHAYVPVSQSLLARLASLDHGNTPPS